MDKTMSRLLLLLVISVGMTVTQAASSKPHVDFLEPDNFTDSLGNEVDKMSNIKFFTSKAKDNYKAGKSVDSSAIAMSAWFSDMSASLARSAMSGGFPFDLVTSFKDGGLGSVEWQGILSDYIGYAIAVALGIILLVVVPVVSFCFCCCRCGGRCGGGRVYPDARDAGYEDTRGRRKAIICFLLPLVFALTGTVLMFLGNQNLSVELDALQDSGLDKIDDIKTFLENTIEQGEPAILGKYNFTLEVLTRDLTNIGFLIGQPTRSSTIKNTGMDDIFDPIIDMQEDAKTILSLLEEIDDLKAEYDDESTSIADDFKNNDLRTKLEKATAPSQPTFTDAVAYLNKMDVADQTELKDVKPTIVELQVHLAAGLRSIVETARSALNEVPEKIYNETETIRGDILNEFSDQTEDLQKRVKEDLENLRTDVLGGIQFDDLKKDGKDSLETVLEYDNYRWYAGLGLAGLALLVVVLLLLGVLFGICGGNANVEPHERGCLSNSGGNLLFAGTLFGLIMAWLMMLLATPLFMASAPAVTVVCGPVRDLGILDTLLNEYDLLEGDNKGNGTYLGNQMFSGSGVDLKLAKLMSTCSAGGTIYEAFQLENTDLLDLDQLSDFNKIFDIDAELGKLDVDFQGMSMDYDVLVDFLELMSSIETEIIDQVLDEAIANSAPVLLRDFELSLSQLLANSASLASNVKTIYQALQSAAQGFESVTADMDPIVTKLETIRDQLKLITNPTSTTSLRVRSDELKGKLQNFNNDWGAATEDAYKKAMQQFSDRVKNILSQAAEGLRDTVTSELGVCTPLSQLYHDLLVKAVCENTVNSLNAWGCAMGMTSVFLMLTFCMSCSLSKHLYRMRTYEDGGPDPSEMASPSAPPAFEMSSMNGRPPVAFNNKVYHSDNAGDPRNSQINHKVAGGYYY